MVEALPFEDWCKVQGRWLTAVGDSNADVDKFPDGVPASGTILLKPNWRIMNFATAVPMGTGVVAKPVLLTLDSEGYLTYNGDRFIYIVPTDDPDGNPVNPTWTVEFMLEDEDGLLNIPSFSFSAPMGTTIDLPSVTPVDTSPGTITIRGEKGDDGPPGGPPGASAYETAVDNGFVGTEAEWIASLEGVDGTPGAPGDNGASAYDLAVDEGFPGTLEEFLWTGPVVEADGTPIPGYRYKVIVDPLDPLVIEDIIVEAI